MDCLRTHPQVCLTAVGHQRVIQAIYETEYQCAVVRGTAGEVTDETEMREALWALCRKYSPDCLERDDSFARVAIWKICIESRQRPLEGLQRPGLTRGAYVDSVCLCLRVLCGSDRRLGQAGHGGGSIPIWPRTCAPLWWRSSAGQWFGWRAPAAQSGHLNRGAGCFSSCPVWPPEGAGCAIFGRSSLERSTRWPPWINPALC